MKRISFDDLPILGDVAFDLALSGAKDDVLRPEDGQIVANWLRRLDFHLERTECALSRRLIVDMWAALRSQKYTYAQVDLDVKEVQRRIYHELEQVVFGFLTQSDAVYFEQPTLFGDNVARVFPNAADDIRQAGNTFAQECYTASVFHLMRALEHGLRYLARKVRLRLPRPVELTEWGAIIDRLEDAIRQIEKGPRTRSRDTRLAYYHGAAAQFRHFKNAWRNHVMHAKGAYSREEAESVLRHVREFLQYLANRG